METWAWLAAYVVAFGLLQLVLYRYFQRETSAETTPAATDRRRQARPERPAEDAAESVRCRHCGTYNERHATIQFCRNCVGTLE
jgi:ribosomal protein S14